MTSSMDKPASRIWRMRSARLLHARKAWPDPQAADKTKPIHEVRIGAIKAAIWRNETEAGVRHNVTLTRKHNITRVFVAQGLSGARRPRQITDQRLGTLEGVAQLRQVGDDRIRESPG
jgi:hypothetical protein